MSFLEFMFQSLGHFVGMMLLIALPLLVAEQIITTVWCRFMRAMCIRKHGWPPAHCDADGDLKP